VLPIRAAPMPMIVFEPAIRLVLAFVCWALWGMRLVEGYGVVLGPVTDTLQSVTVTALGAFAFPAQVTFVPAGVPNVSTLASPTSTVSFSYPPGGTQPKFSVNVNDANGKNVNMLVKPSLAATGGVSTLFIDCPSVFLGSMATCSVPNAGIPLYYTVSEVGGRILASGLLLQNTPRFTYTVPSTAQSIHVAGSYLVPTPTTITFAVDLVPDIGIALTPSATLPLSSFTVSVTALPTPTASITYNVINTLGVLISSTTLSPGYRTWSFAAPGTLGVYTAAVTNGAASTSSLLSVVDFDMELLPGTQVLGGTSVTATVSGVITASLTYQQLNGLTTVTSTVSPASEETWSFTVSTGTFTSYTVRVIQAGTSISKMVTVYAPTLVSPTNNAHVPLGGFLNGSVTNLLPASSYSLALVMNQVTFTTTLPGSSSNFAVQMISNLLVPATVTVLQGANTQVITVTPTAPQPGFARNRFRMGG
jgi:hypothetical protein